MVLTPLLLTRLLFSFVILAKCWNRCRTSLKVRSPNFLFGSPRRHASFDQVGHLIIDTNKDLK